MIEDIFRDNVDQTDSVRKNLSNEFSNQSWLSRSHMMKLYNQINEFRNKNSLNEYFEDHCISEALELSEVTNFNQLLDCLNFKINEEDIFIASFVAKVSNHSLINLKNIYDLEKYYKQVIDEMVFSNFKDQFKDPSYTNIAISTCYTEDSINIDIILSRTIFSVDSITRKSGIITIQGNLNEENYALFATKVHDDRFEAIISPNQMSYDVFNKTISINVDEKILSKMKGNIRFSFYVKKGKNSVRYGQGTNLNQQDMIRMGPFLIIAYDMKCEVRDSIRSNKRNFLSSVNKENPNFINRNLPQLVRQNAYSPKFGLGDRGMRRRASSLEKDNRGSAKKHAKSPEFHVPFSKWYFRSKEKSNFNKLFANDKIELEDEILKTGSCTKKYRPISKYNSPNMRSEAKSYVISSSPMSTEENLLKFSEARNQLNNLLLCESEKKENSNPNLEIKAQSTKDAEDTKKENLKTPSILNSNRPVLKTISVAKPNEESKILGISKSKKKLNFDQSSRKKVIIKSRDPISNQVSPISRKDEEINKSASKSGLVRIMNINDQIYNPIANLAPRINYIPKQDFINPLLFKEPEFSVSTKAQLELLEKNLPGEQPEKIQKFMVLYHSKDLCDVIIQVENENLQAHKIVLLQSPFFMKYINLSSYSPKETVINMPKNFTSHVFKKILRYLYYGKLDHAEIETMDIRESREMLQQANELKLAFLMKILILRVIIPKMDRSECLEFLKETQNKEEYRPIWKTLEKYCISFFALNSKSILSKYPQKIFGLNTDLLLKASKKAIQKCKDIDNMYQILAILVESGYAGNLFEIIEKSGCKNREFDSKYISNRESIANLLDPKVTYQTCLLNCDDTFQNNKYSSRILEETSNLDLNDKPLNHLELSLRSNSHLNYIYDENFRDMMKKKFNYELKIEIPANSNSWSIISSSFDSHSRSWRLVIDLNSSGDISCFLMEAGNPTYTLGNNKFKPEFTSARFILQIKDGEKEYNSCNFYTFANDHNFCIGQRNFMKFSELDGKESLNIRVWIAEIPLFSCSLQYLSTRFNDLLKQLFQTSTKTATFSLDPEEEAFLGSKSNDINLPNVFKRRTIEKKMATEQRRKKSMSSLEINFFKAKSVEEASQKVEQTNLQSKFQGFSSICPYLFYYLLTSDKLTIEHEKFLAYFLYMIPKDHFDERIKLMVAGIRFSYVELSKLFNLARDIPYLKMDPFFISKLDFEVSHRMKSNQPLDKKRRFYSDELYKNWNFKNDLMKWLIDSDHHQSYKLKVEDLNRIIQEKDNQLKNNEKKLKNINEKLLYESKQKLTKEKFKPKLQEWNNETIQKSETVVKILDPPNDQNKKGMVEKFKGLCSIF